MARKPMENQRAYKERAPSIKHYNNYYNHDDVMMMMTMMMMIKITISICGYLTNAYLLLTWTLLYLKYLPVSMRT